MTDEFEKLLWQEIKDIRKDLSQFKTEIRRDIFSIKSPLFLIMTIGSTITTIIISITLFYIKGRM